MNYKTTITFTPEQLAMIKAGLGDLAFWYNDETGKISEHAISAKTIETIKALAAHIKDMHAVTLSGQGQ